MSEFVSMTERSTKIHKVIRDGVSAVVFSDGDDPIFHNIESDPSLTVVDLSQAMTKTDFAQSIGLARVEFGPNFDWHSFFSSGRYVVLRHLDVFISQYWSATHPTSDEAEGIMALIAQAANSNRLMITLQRDESYWPTMLSLGLRSASFTHFIEASFSPVQYIT